MAAATKTYDFTDEQKEKLLKQVEFYFSDSNLPRDAFMLEKVQSAPEGFVSIALLATFSRMSKLLSSSYHDATYVPAELVEAMAKVLETSSVLTLNEERSSVKRTEALPEFDELAKQVDERSLYVSPFPFDTTLDQLTDFFGKTGDLRSVRMRRHLSSKDFRGSVFVEFATPDEAKRVAGLSLVFEGAPLNIEPKLEFVARREAEKAAQPAEEQEAAAPAKAKVSPGQKRPREEPEAEVVLDEYTPGCCVAFDFGEDCEFAEAPTFGLIKDSFGGKDAGLKYADYNQGDKKGVVRFAEPEQAAQVLTCADESGSMMVAGYKAQIKLLEGEEEKQYMAVVASSRESKRAEGGKGQNSGRGRGGRGRGGRGGRGRGRR